ncbi:MAG: peptidoglycan-binding protein [Chloroflexota bacterium]
MRGRRAGAAGLLAGIAIAGGGYLYFRDVLPATEREEAPLAPVVARSTVPVERATLRATEELDATLAYRGDGVLVNRLLGTFTQVPDDGAIMEQGDVVGEVDGTRRIVLLYGERPAWRAISADVEGADVRQLEIALKELGYLGAGLVPDRELGQVTEDAIAERQRDLGVGDDWRVELGEVLFVPGPVRIAARAVEPGEPARPGAPIARTTSAERVVLLPLEADRQDIRGVGDAGTIELPDGTETPGRVEEIGRVATRSADGDLVVEVTIVLDDPAVTGSLDGAPVTVTIDRDVRADVLTVPVDALLALAEGGYAVERVRADGTTELVGVLPGLFADDRVEVTGELAPGDAVVVPR